MTRRRRRHHCFVYRHVVIASFSSTGIVKEFPLNVAALIDPSLDLSAATLPASV